LALHVREEVQTCLLLTKHDGGLQQMHLADKISEFVNSPELFPTYMYIAHCYKQI